MVGENCWIPGCGTSRRTKGIYFHKLPCHPVDAEWRQKLENMIRLYRVVDDKLAKRMKDGNIYTCYKHFKDEDFYITPSGKRKLDINVMPTLNLPVKSHETEKRPERPIPKREPLPVKTNTACYSNINELNIRCQKLKIAWDFRISDAVTYIELNVSPFLIPKYRIKVDDSLDFTITVFNWPLPDDHIIYKEHRRSFRNVFISDLVKEIEAFNLCPGVDVAIESSKLHGIPVEIDENTVSLLTSKEMHRDQSCVLLTTASSLCEKCEKMMKNNVVSKIRTEKKSNIPAQPNAPLSHTNPQRVVLALKQQRAECKKQKVIIERLETEIAKNNMDVENNLGATIMDIMRQNEETLTPFMKLFWSEQRKYHAKGQIRYHPMIIRFALSLAMKSGSAYDELRKSGILILPSRRTLSDYKNAITPSTGFNPNVIAELKKKCDVLNDLEKLVVLSFDEVKIQSDLVLDKHSGRVIGFVDMGDEDINMATFDNLDAMATHVLCFMLRSFLGHIKFSLGYFATDSVVAHQLMPIFWKAVSILEISCQLKVIAAVCDGASSNRIFFSMHANLSGNSEPGVTYRALNIYAPSRYIWFFSDYPHLIKTSRNCLFNSGFGTSFSRLMWNNGHYLIWQHIRDILKLNSYLKVAPKMRDEHVNLSSRSKMRVNLAVQTLSATNALLLQKYCGPETQETAKFCSLMNTFFDIMNVRNTKEHITKKNPTLRVFESLDDERFDWLKNVFLKYFDDWKECLDKSGFDAKAKEKMFISRQTIEGIKITVFSMIECTKYLLQSGMRYVLTEKFCQDLVEHYFGLQRACGNRSDNPNLYQFGYNDNAYRMTEKVSECKIAGNIKGGQEKKKYSWYGITEEALPKRKKEE